MHEQSFPHIDFNEFSNNRTLLLGDTSAVYLAEKNGKFFVIYDKDTVGEFSWDPEVANSSIKVVGFDSAEERCEFIGRKNWLSDLRISVIPVFFSIIEFYTNQICDFAWTHYNQEGLGAALLDHENALECFLKDGQPPHLRYVVWNNPELQALISSLKNPKLKENVTSYDPWTSCVLLVDRKESGVSLYTVLDRDSRIPKSRSQDLAKAEQGAGEAYGFFNCKHSKQVIEAELDSIRQKTGTPSDLQITLLENTTETIKPYPSLWECARRTLTHPSKALSSKARFPDSRPPTASALQYLMVANSPNLGGLRTARALCRILSGIHQPPLHGTDEVFHSAVLYKTSSDSVVTYSA